MALRFRSNMCHKSHFQSYKNLQSRVWKLNLKLTIALSRPGFLSANKTIIKSNGNWTIYLQLEANLSQKCFLNKKMNWNLTKQTDRLIKMILKWELIPLTITTSISSSSRGCLKCIWLKLIKVQFNCCNNKEWCKFVLSWKPSQTRLIGWWNHLDTRRLRSPKTLLHATLTFLLCPYAPSVGMKIL